MVVDVGFTGIKHVGITGPIAQRQKPTAVNLTGDAMRQHEKIMEYRHEISKLNSNLSAAMSSLASSNAEIDRLNARVLELESELNAEREKNAKLASQSGQQKQSKKNKKDKGDDAQDPEQQD